MGRMEEEDIPQHCRPDTQPAFPLSPKTGRSPVFSENGEDGRRYPAALQANTQPVFPLSPKIGRKPMFSRKWGGW